MSDKSERGFISVNITRAARSALRAAVLELTTPAGRRVTLSTALVACVRVALRHRDEVAAVLREGV